MEFLSVRLDKQPQFCSCDRNQPERRRLTHVFPRVSLLSFFLFFCRAFIFGACPLLFRLECNFSYEPSRFIFYFISSLSLRDSLNFSSLPSLLYFICFFLLLFLLLHFSLSKHRLTDRSASNILQL